MQALRQERKKSGLTQEQLAERVNVARQTISHYETGIRTPSVYMAKKIAHALSCDWAALYEDD